jgi:hypothetical protein
MTRDHPRRWIGAARALALATAFVGLLASDAAADPITLEGLADFAYTGDSSGANATGTLVFGPGAGTLNSVLNTSNPALLALTAAEVSFTAALDPSTMPVVTSGPWPHTRDAVLVGSGPNAIEFRVDGDLLLALNIVTIAVSQAIGFTEQVTLASLDPGSFGQATGSVLSVAASPLAAAVGGVGTNVIFHAVFDSVPGFGGSNGGPPIWYDDFTSDASRVDWSIKILTAPEPASALLVGAGLLGLMAVARRTRPRP